MGKLPAKEQSEQLAENIDNELFIRAEEIIKVVEYAKKEQLQKLRDQNLLKNPDQHDISNDIINQLENMISFTVKPEHAEDTPKVKTVNLAKVDVPSIKLGLSEGEIQEVKRIRKLTSRNHICEISTGLSPISLLLNKEYSLIIN